jgi:hypothetical protein
MMRETLKAAVDIVENLQDWIEDRDGLSTVPHAWVTYTPAYEIAIGVGEAIVWTTECGYCNGQDDTSLSYRGCKLAFLSTITDLKPFFSEADSCDETKGDA